MFEGDRIVAVELAVSGERDCSKANADGGGELVSSAQAPREVAISIPVSAGCTEAVDASRALEADRRSQGRLSEDQRRGPARAGGGGREAPPPHAPPRGTT